MSFWDWWFAPRRRLGCLPDPVDPRDFTLEALELSSARLPASASVAHPAVGIRDQGTTNSCVGFALTTAMRLALLRQGKAAPELSPYFVYFNARKHHQKATVVDTGTSLRAALLGAMRLGFCPEHVWPTLPGRINRGPEWAAFRAAHDFRGLRGYYRIDPGDFRGVRTALAAGFPVVAGFPVGQAFLDLRTRGPVTAFHAQNSVGGHALVIESYSGSTFGSPGSWGIDHGQGGRLELTEGFMALAVDQWAIDTRPK